MNEGGSDSLPDEEVVKINYAKDKWVDAWLEGNVLLPQLSLCIKVFLLASLLEDEIGDLDAIYRSELSPQQLDNAANIMNGHHRAHSVKAVTADYHEQLLGKGKATGENAILSDRIQKIWEKGIKLAVDILYSNLEQSTAAVLDFRTFIFKIREIFGTPEFKALAKEYRDSFDPARPSLQALELYVKKISKFVMSKLSQELPPLQAMSRERYALLLRKLGLIYQSS